VHAGREREREREREIDREREREKERDRRKVVSECTHGMAWHGMT
jgi:hypothetical protein